MLTMIVYTAIIVDKPRGYAVIGTHLIIGDVHAVYKPFERAVRYANDNLLHLISVGDLVDNNYEGHAVIKLLLAEMQAGRASAVFGNHEWKIRRWIDGNDVKITPPNQPTVDEMRVNQQFVDDFNSVTDRMSFYIELNDEMVVSHAAAHPKWWNNRDHIDRKIRDYMMYGHADSSQVAHYRGETYPIRLYDWTDAVPHNHWLFVGHDPRPMIGVPDFNNYQLAPLVHKNDSGGATVFLDAGSGKGGTLWGAVVNSADRTLQGFINFGQ